MKICIYIFCLLTSSILFSQATCFNSGQLFISKGAEMYVFGNVVNSANSDIQNYGRVQTFNDVNEGDILIQGQSTVYSKGDWIIANDWINNGLLNIDSGLVELYNDNQWILGDSISNFWNLKLSGIDIKELGQHCIVSNQLNITDREFAVHDKQLTIANSDVNSILFDDVFLNEGFISTDQDGVIKRVISPSLNYTTPTGSALGLFERFRPLKSEMIQGGAIDTLIITFHHHSPDLEALYTSNLDTSLCKVQEQYYYTIGNISASAKYKFDFSRLISQDGDYPHPVKWGGSEWKARYPSSEFIDLNYLYSSVHLEENFNPNHYSLGYRTPKAPQIDNDSTECYSTAVYTASTQNDYNYFEWHVLNNSQTAEILSGQGSNSVLVNWNDNIGGWIVAQYIDTAGCNSYPDSLEVIDVSVEAAFSYTHNYSDGFGTLFTFLNESSSNGDNAVWIIENNQTWVYSPDAFDPYFYTFYTDGEETEFDVKLVAQNSEYGCLDTAYTTIVTPRIFVFYAPNSVTPNGDGVNDFFHCETSDIFRIEMKIFNRWGELLSCQEGLKSSDVLWDCKYNGELVPSGSYTYQFTVWPKNYNKGLQSALLYTGHINVLR